MTARDVIHAWRQEGATHEQIAAFVALIRERGGLTGNMAEDLELVCIAYSRACGRHDCCSWVNFWEFPDWEDSVKEILEAP